MKPPLHITFAILGYFHDPVMVDFIYGWPLPLKINAISENIDHLFRMQMGTLIIFMQAGFAFLEAGSVRAKNTINILIKNFSDLCFGKLDVEQFMKTMTQDLFLPIRKIPLKEIL